MTTFKLITLNTCLFPPGLRQCIKSTDKEGRIKKIKTFIDEENADVYCFQEVFSSIWSSKWKDYLLSHKFHYAECPLPSLCNGHIIDSGLLILSKYPILSSSFISFIDNSIYGVNRGFLHITIQVNKQIIHVINIHLHPCEGSCTNKCSKSIRSKQINQIYNYINKFNNIDSKIILVGDFNIDQDSWEYDSTIDNILPVDAIIPLYKSTTHRLLPFCNNSSESCCDYAFGKNINILVPTVLINYNQLSDHYPISIYISS